MNRPARMDWYPAVTAVAWMTTPRMNTVQATRMEYLRERESAMKEDMRVLDRGTR